MTAIHPVLARFVGMSGLAAGIWFVGWTVYAAAAGLPPQSMLLPSATNVAVVLVFCLLGALPRNFQ